MLWKEFNRETQLHGLATTGGVVSSTGIAGLTLGGGLGWLMPKYGLALDNLRSAEMVLADGRVVQRQRAGEPGSVLGDSRRRRQLRHRGVARVQPAPGRADDHRRPRGASAAATRVDVLRFFRDACASLPDEQMLVAGLLTGPDGVEARRPGRRATAARSRTARRR